MMLLVKPTTLNEAIGLYRFHIAVALHFRTGFGCIRKEIRVTWLSVSE